MRHPPQNPPQAPAPFAPSRLAAALAAALAVLARRLIPDRAGNVALIVAFAAIPLVGMVGFATDYGLELAAKAKLDHAADAAAVAAITSAQTYIVNYTGSGDPTAGAIAAGKTQALAQFAANTGTLPGTAPTPTVQMAVTGLTVTAQVSYGFAMPTIFMRSLGPRTMSFTGSSASTLSIPAFTNIYMVIDISSSMGIGATAADQQIVYNATGGCAVACHYTNTTTSARNAGATLRIDVAKQAVVAALNRMIASGNAGRFKVAIYTMSDAFTTLFALSGNLSGAITAVNGIDLSAANNDGGTDTTYGLGSLNGGLATVGSGLTANSPKGTIMLITDGVQDSDMKYLSRGNWTDGYDPNFTVYNPCNQANCQKFSQFATPIYVESFDPASCTPLKSKGYTMMTLNTTYIVPPASLQSSSPALNSVFDYIQTYLQSAIATNMGACASSSTYAFSATTPAQINTAVAQMFAATGALARISQ